MAFEIAPRKRKPLGLIKSAAFVGLAMLAGFAGGYLYSQNDTSDSGVVRQSEDRDSELISQIVDDVGQSVVSIDVVSRGSQQTAFGSLPITRESAGTGFIISEGGVIVTNRHVVPENSDISITLDDGTELENVSVIGRTALSDSLDVAFLKIEDNEGKDLKPVKLGDSTKVDVGQRVVAIGNALGQFQNTVTAGIISGYGRDILAQDGSGAENLQDLFQTDASINQGNSGGPLVNMQGEVIAINVAAAAGGAENIGFAIPISDIQGLIRSVLNEGELKRPFLGVRYVSLTDDAAERLDLETKRGAYIVPDNGSQTSIVEGSPAAEAGLKEKDIIVRINDIEVDERSSLASILGRFSVGDQVTLTVVRGVETMNLEVTLEAASTE